MTPVFPAAHPFRPFMRADVHSHVLPRPGRQRINRIPDLDPDPKSGHFVADKGLGIEAHMRALGVDRSVTLGGVVRADRVKGRQRRAP